MQTERKQRLAELIDDFDSAMLVTQTSDGGLRSRPMAPAEHDGSGRLLFITSLDSAKVDEVQENSQVNVAFQGDDTYLSLTARATLRKDRPTIEKAWSPAMKAWFPEGKSSIDLVVLEVEAESGEYWNMRTRDKLAFVVEAGTALIQGESVDEEKAGEHAKVDLN